MKEMTGRERLLTAMAHEEPDRVPISPRYHAWMTAAHGPVSLQRQRDEILPDLDFMHVVDDGTPNYMESYPEAYDLPEVRVEQRRYTEADCEFVDRVFHTPAGDLSDLTRLPPSGREYGVSPTPVKQEHLVKQLGDIERLAYLLPEINRDFSGYRKAEQIIGERGLAMVCVRSSLDHQAGFARDMQDIMVDFYTDRAFFDELLGFFHRRSMAILEQALEAGVKTIFGSWYFAVPFRRVVSGDLPGGLRAVDSRACGVDPLVRRLL